MIAAIEDIQRLVGARSADDLAEDRTTLLAVLYSFVTLGEAVRGVPEDIRDQHPEVPRRAVLAMRNVVTHVYFGVSPARVMQTVHEDLPSLLRSLRAILPADPA